jgi:hypothetical protein
MGMRWLTEGRHEAALCCVTSAALSLACLVVPAEGQTVRSVVSPGPVIEGHAEVEAQCEKCHQAFDKDAQNPLCLSCHEEVAADVKESRGAHGRTFVRKGTQCSECHTDHRGRTFDIVALDPAVFRHEWTDYPLTGAHIAVACADCHAAGEVYRLAPLECVACHRADDPHRGALGNECSTCHDTVVGWAGGKFDHSTTEFLLRGAHRETECAGCHPSERYAETPTRCVDCHRLDDAHDGERGERCGDCHTETEWKKTKFDHDATAFPLRGVHVSIRCADCHGSDVNAPLAVTCFSCHADDDVHKSEQGERCETCHDERGWAEEVRFDHDLARFPLAGMHSVAACEACHASGRYRDTPRECIACHRTDDAHEGRLGERCVDCHSPEDWSRWEFDHGARTRFALDGAHEGVRCESCHVRRGVAVAKPRMECVSCHERDDVHAGAFGTACQRCHDTTDFGAALGPVR